MVIKSVSLDVMKQNFGDKNPSVGKIYFSLTNIYNDEKKPDSALFMFQNSICSLVEGFNKNNIYENPSISKKDMHYNYSNIKVLDELKLFETLLRKAETFFLKE